MDKNEDTENLWFMQDGTTGHTSLGSITLLREFFSQTSDIAAWWHLLASTVSWFESMWFISMGSPQCNSFFLRTTRLSTILRTPFKGKLHWFPLLCLQKVRENFWNLLWHNNGAYMSDIICTSWSEKLGVFYRLFM